MAKFVFNLDAVLRQRLLAEQERQRDLAVHQGEMVRLQGELKALNDSIQSSAADLKDNRLTGPIDVAFLAAHRRYSVAMQRRGMQLVQDMARQQRKVDDAQRLLAEAAKDRKVMEKLREKQYERWRAEQASKELAATDEVGMQLAQRRALNAADR
jgi:flagellar FliJ protein